MYLYSYYIQKGHSIKDLYSLDELEKHFYCASMVLELERQGELSDEFRKSLGSF